MLVTDACGAGNEEAAKRSIENLRFAGDTVLEYRKNLWGSPARVSFMSCDWQLVAGEPHKFFRAYEYRVARKSQVLD